MPQDTNLIPAIKEQDIFLISILMDANRSPNGWATFLNIFLKHFKLRACHLYIADMTTLTPLFQETCGPKNELDTKIYIERYLQTDHTNLAILNGNPNQWFASNLMDNWDEIQKSPVYVEWGLPNGIINGAGATLFREGNWTCVLTTNRTGDQGGYTYDELDRLKALSPYIEKAMRFRMEFLTQDNQLNRTQALVNQFRLPTALINEFGELIALNNTISAFLEQESILKIDNEKHLQLQDNALNKKFNMAITKSIGLQKGNNFNYDNHPIKIKGKHDQYIIGISELTEGSVDSPNQFIGALIYIASINISSTISENTLMRIFKLTPAEALVCHHFSSGKSLKAIAKNESKSLYTVQEQLRNSYKKTKTKNQLELINLLASLPVN